MVNGLDYKYELPSNCRLKASPHESEALGLLAQMYALKLLVAITVLTSGFEFHEHKRHLHSGMHIRELPSFLRNVSNETRNEFFGIVRNRTIPRREIRERAEQWAQKQEYSVMEEFHKFDANRTARFTEIHKKVDVVISELPSAHEEVHKILTNDSLSRDQVIEKLRNLKIDPVVGRSLRGIMFAVVHPRKPGNGKHHHFHKNISNSFIYEGSGPLSAVLEHAGRSDEAIPIGAEDQEQPDFA
ncbi:hypothetical protein RB195_009025 [Necator americanus]|uniref:SXP/RAL-2 family protein Ani s 5-like cation-binding domain-containing protein n=1 Tax=Necator americanus TaxID=51031 RepID=A0ABR1CU01_NECAM